MTPRAAARFDVLVVCTANVNRSPLTAAVLRHHLEQRFGVRAARVRVSTAGTRALVGEEVDPAAAQVAAELARPPEPGSTARQLDERLVTHADLVLVMTRQHRAAVVDLVPAAQRRTFTLPELARVARALVAAGRAPAPGADVVTGWRALLAAAPALRGPTAPADPADDDVPDVHGHPLEEQRRAGRRVVRAVEAVLAALPGERLSGS